MNINKFEDNVVGFVPVQDEECTDEFDIDINKVEDNVVDCVESRMKSVLMIII